MCTFQLSLELLDQFVILPYDIRLYYMYDPVLQVNVKFSPEFPDQPLHYFSFAV